MLPVRTVVLVISLATASTLTLLAHVEASTTRSLQTSRSRAILPAPPLTTSLICSNCHPDSFPHKKGSLSGKNAENHNVDVLYPTQNLRGRSLRSRPDVYLENGKMVCTSCHDGYTKHLTIGTAKHLLPVYSRGTVSCNACHNK